MIVRKADALLDIAGWARRHPFVARDEIDAIVLRTFSRATDCVEAVAILVKQELPDQASVLCRTLFEDAVVTLWVSVNPDAASVLARSREHVSLWGTKIDQWKAGGENEHGGRWAGSSHWTGESLHTLIGQIDEWTREDVLLNALAEGLRDIYRDPLKLTQAFVHNSPFTMRPWQLTWDRDEVASALTHRWDEEQGDRVLQQASLFYEFIAIAAKLQVSDEPPNDVAAASLRRTTPWPAIKRIYPFSINARGAVDLRLAGSLAGLFG